MGIKKAAMFAVLPVLAIAACGGSSSSKTTPATQVPSKVVAAWCVKAAMGDITATEPATLQRALALGNGAVGRLAADSPMQLALDQVVVTDAYSEALSIIRANCGGFPTDSDSSPIQTAIAQVSS